MTQSESQMKREILEIPEAVERLLSLGGANIVQAADDVRAIDPPFLMSVARGSSDHACTYLKYASELLLQRPMASVGPSVQSIYGVNLRCDRSVCVSVSQSGQSPDIVQMTRSLAEAGSYAVAITNNDESRLAKVSNATLPIHAGPELSVAATKTFVTSIIAGLWFLAEWKHDEALKAALFSLPEFLSQATSCDWGTAAGAMDGRPLYTLGRGPSWAISNEAALKFKETCLIQAESYSSAEVMHGPVSIVEQGFPVLIFAGADAAETSVAGVADELAAKGAQVFATTSLVKQANVLPHVRTGHWLTDPIAAIVSFYGMVDQVAANRGINPDVPRHLNKVTETV
ncbi:SIS domain-containing protein [Shimia abyssi]|uniref:Glutamine--fructose-6-phosphate transaminase n=1 Tax=Shimia abyssi TaxID=1662395 RepID=A0A2P8F9V8_9RHOB|nr:SIS domain-containing protein [Shimia abyssi]PSL18452.1 glutamine--fructose-6-phosphate transaminase [Shimia abyssi]